MGHGFVSYDLLHIMGKAKVQELTEIRYSLEDSLNP